MKHADMDPKGQFFRGNTRWQPVEPRGSTGAAVARAIDGVIGQWHNRSMDEFSALFSHFTNNVGPLGDILIPASRALEGLNKDSNISVGINELAATIARGGMKR